MKIRFREEVGEIPEEIDIDDFYERANEYTVFMTAGKISLDEMTKNKNKRTITVEGTEWHWSDVHHYEADGLYISKISKNRHCISCVDELGNVYSRPLTQGLINDYGIEIVNEYIIGGF